MPGLLFKCFLNNYILLTKRSIIDFLIFRIVKQASPLHKRGQPLHFEIQAGAFA